MVIDISTPVKAYFTDDDLDDFELFCEAVAKFSNNIELVSFSSCENLLEALKDTMPDIIFIDLNLGRMTGIECLRELQTMPQFSLVPKVVMSTTASQKQVLECMDLGCDYYLQKPSTFDGVMNEMQAIFSRYCNTPK